MKQRHLILTPVLALSFLLSCSNKSIFNSIFKLTGGTLCTVIFDSKGGSGTPDTQAIEAGQTASEPTTPPTKDDFTFGGWYTDKEATEYKYDFSRPVLANLILYARWNDARDFATITFDATENGKFANTTRYVSFSALKGSKLYPYIDIMKEFEPVASNKTFACYSYKDNDGAIIDYEDTINSNITLEANYLDNSKVPYDNLDNLDDSSWDYIKQVAVTKKDPSKVFKVGATKTVNLYNQPHKVRTIGYNHDNLTSKTTTAGITFEFVNLITKEDGTSYKTYWDENGTNAFINSTFYTLLDSVFSDLPKSLKDVTQTVEKYVGVGYEKDTTPVRDSTPYDTKLFPLAHDEISNPTYDDQPEGEGTLYDYYELHKDDTTYRMKARVGGGSEPYWLRSPRCTWYLNYPDAWMVHENTGILAGREVCESEQVQSGIAFAPAFCI